MEAFKTQDTVQNHFNLKESKQQLCINFLSNCKNLDVFLKFLNVYEPKRHLLHKEEAPKK